MPGDDGGEMTLPEAEATLRADGRYGWLLTGRQAWGVADVAQHYGASTGVAVSHDTVTRWVKRLPALYGPAAAENYGGTIGWRASRDALVRFFAAGRHLRGSD